MVDLATNDERKCGCEPLLQKHPDFHVAVHLSPEGRHAEVVLGTQSGRSSPLSRPHHARWLKVGLEVQGSLDFIAEFLRVGGLDVAGRLELSSGNPRRSEGLKDWRLADRGEGGRCGCGRVGKGGEFGEVRRGEFKDGWLRPLDDGLKAQGQARRDRVKEGDKVDAGTVQETGVHRFDREGVVWTEVVVLDLQHGLARLVGDLPLNFCDVLRRPALVRSNGNLTCARVDTTLEKGLHVSPYHIQLSSQLTLALAKTTPKLYDDGRLLDPRETACVIWKAGLAEIILVISARAPSKNQFAR